MILIKRVFACSKLIPPLIFNIGQIPSRPSSIPTQKSQFLQSFSINNLHDNPGARRYPKQLGRGKASGKGKTSARGHKGTNARSGGGVSVRYEGGQSPIHRRIPKYGRGRARPLYPYLDYLTLGKLQYFISRGIVNTSQVITMHKLKQLGIISHKIRHGLKILAKGAEDFTSKVTLQVTDASKNAIQRVKQNGGQIKLVYRSPPKFREHMHPERHNIPVQQTLPQYRITKKLDRIEKQRGVKIEYLKPKWKIQQEKLLQQNKVQQQTFKYPASREPNPNKIHKRRQKPYRVISYKL